MKVVSIIKNQNNESKNSRSHRRNRSNCNLHFSNFSINLLNQIKMKSLNEVQSECLKNFKEHLLSGIVEERDYIHFYKGWLESAYIILYEEKTRKSK